MVAGRRRGRVLDEQGQPVAEALVSVVAGSARTPEIAVVTNARGEFHLALPPGRFQLEARAPDGRRGYIETEVPATGRIEIRI